jgi:hypothetical protein
MYEHFDWFVVDLTRSYNDLGCVVHAEPVSRS